MASLDKIYVASFFVIVYFAYMCNALTSMLIPLLAKNEFAASFTAVGFVVSSFGVGRILADVPIGSLSDKYRKEWLIVFGASVLALSSVATYLADDPAEVAALQLSQGVGGAVLAVVGYGLMSDISPIDKRGKYLSHYQMILFLGNITGPILGGTIAESYGIRAPFLLIGLAVLAVTAVTFPTLRKSNVDKSNKRQSYPVSLAALKQALSSRQYMVVAFVTFGVFSATAIYGTAFPLYGQDYMKLRYADIGFVATISNVPYLLSVIWSSVALDRFGRKSTLLVGSLLMAIASFAMLFTIRYWYVTSILCVFSFASGMVITAQATLSIDLANPDRIGSYLGVNRMFNDLGGIVGPVIVGILLDTSVPASPFLAVGMMGFAIAAVSTVLRAHKR